MATTNYCGNCGAASEAASTQFCVNCGTPMTPPASGAIDQQPGGSAAVQPPRRRTGRIILWSILGLCVLLLGAFGIGVVTSGVLTTPQTGSLSGTLIADSKETCAELGKMAYTSGPGEVDLSVTPKKFLFLKQKAPEPQVTIQSATDSYDLTSFEGGAAYTGGSRCTIEWTATDIPLPNGPDTLVNIRLLDGSSTSNEYFGQLQQKLDEGTPLYLACGNACVLDPWGTPPT
ncbi:MAG: hypothetical protein QG597_4771 [Actinomycetota bacterium]|nr:hypothetical protein [Actinomycetota bacterium]